MKIEMYRGRKLLRQVWRWRARSGNGRIIATGAEAYTNKSDALAAVTALMESDYEIHIEEDTPVLQPPGTP